MTTESGPRKRIWQLTDMALIEKRQMPRLITLNRRDRDQGVDLFAEIQPSPAAQYVLLDTAIDYDQQLKAMKGYARKYKLVEIGEDKEGVNEFAPKPAPSAADAVKMNEELRKQNEALIKRLEALEALRGRGKDSKEDR